ncbi:GL23120 [Drosophila persimilis]|uniref:GL23120 n=1 Tax=Drosophila persimilis TaxID=7234 RepID=B4G5R5_DROPE|nr:GL23120 [Drosophila persimilis]
MSSQTPSGELHSSPHCWGSSQWRLGSTTPPDKAIGAKPVPMERASEPARRMRETEDGRSGPTTATTDRRRAAQVRAAGVAAAGNWFDLFRAGWLLPLANKQQQQKQQQKQQQRNSRTAEHQQQQQRPHRAEAILVRRHILIAFMKSVFARQHAPAPSSPQFEVHSSQSTAALHFVE